MPRYFIDTFNGIALIDDEGRELPDEDAVRNLVRRALADMLMAEGAGRSSAQFRADVRDESGERLLTATLLMVIGKATGKRDGTA